MEVWPMSIYRWYPQDSGLVNGERSAQRLGRTRREEAPLGPAMDVYETADGLVIDMALPGVAPDDVSITVSGDTLTIEGQLAIPEEDADRQYLLRERPVASGRFARSVTLPGSVDGAQAEALFRNGVLTLTVPKAEESRPKQIQVKVG